MAKRCSNNFLYQAIEIANDCDLNYRLSKNKRLLLELTLIRLCQLTETLQITKKEEKQVIKPIEYYAGSLQKKLILKDVKSKSANTARLILKAPEVKLPMQGRLMLKVAEIKQLLERLMLKVLKKTKERQQKKRQTKMRPIFKSGSCQGG